MMLFQTKYKEIFWLHHGIRKTQNMHSEKNVILDVEFESKKNELKESNKNRELLSELYEK